VVQVAGVLDEQLTSVLTTSESSPGATEAEDKETAARVSPPVRYARDARAFGPEGVDIDVAPPGVA
jgi:hypothetical protein